MHIPGGAHTRITFENPEGYLDVLMWFNVCIYVHKSTNPSC